MHLNQHIEIRYLPKQRSIVKNYRDAEGFGLFQPHDPCTFWVTTTEDILLMRSLLIMTSPSC